MNQQMVKKGRVQRESQIKQYIKIGSQMAHNSKQHEIVKAFQQHHALLMLLAHQYLLTMVMMILHCTPIMQAGHSLSEVSVRARSQVESLVEQTGVLRSDLSD